MRVELRALSRPGVHAVQPVSPPLQSAVSVLWQDESEFTSLHITGV